MKIRTWCVVFGLFNFLLMIGCGLSNGPISGRDEGRQLQVEQIEASQVDEIDMNNVYDKPDGQFQDIPTNSENNLHPIFAGAPGVPVTNISLGAVDPDPSTHSACTDYDGDSIPNSDEKATNIYTADYPRIMTSVTTPVQIEIRRSKTDITKNYTQEIAENDVESESRKFTNNRIITNLGTKTLPLETRQSIEKNAGSDMWGGDSITSIQGAISGSSGSSSETIVDHKGGKNDTAQGWQRIKDTPVMVATIDEFDTTNTITNTGSFNESSWDFGTSVDKSSYGDFKRQWDNSTNTQKTNYSEQELRDDNTFNDQVNSSDTIERNSTHYRISKYNSTEIKTGPNAGFVRAGLYIKNATVNMPARISNVVCTLSFTNEQGQLMPIKTFRLRNEDYSLFEQDIMGNEVLGPYTIELDNLNTMEIENAMDKGYSVKIHIVSYDLGKVPGSNYDPIPNNGNLKIVEETAKGRTAAIKIQGTNIRDFYRVTAFDVRDADENGNNGVIVPGISLKKAIFNIFSDRVGKGEKWTEDRNGNGLTVPDDRLTWSSAFVADPTSDSKLLNKYDYTDGIDGNSWSNFETYIKTYTTVERVGNTLEEVEHKFESIKRIGQLNRYDPFMTEDNPFYNPNEYLDKSELAKMKYWIILHNGQYFYGDINDPIWAGERYEIICVDIKNFNEQFKGYNFSPLQSNNPFYLTTRWNRLSNKSELARAVNIGSVLSGDTIKLEVQRAVGTSLFSPEFEGREFGNPVVDASFDEFIADGLIWHDFN